jgi:hypothetical protein
MGTALANNVSGNKEYTCSPLKGGSGYQVTCHINPDGTLEQSSCSCAGGFLMIDYEKPVGTSDPKSASPG